MDEQGWFYLVDRSKDMIVASGFKVWPREVEEVLYQHPAVREAAVVGIPDPYRGETIKAVISLKPGQHVTADEIRAFARERMAAYKYPRVVEIMDDLPKTTSGKIMRRLLQPTAHASALPVQAEIVDVSYPQLRVALEARAVLEAGAAWLRLSRGTLPLATTAALYERLRAHARAAARWPHVRRSRGVLRGERGLSRGRRRSRRERAPVARVPPPALARPVPRGAEEHATPWPRTASTSTSI